MKQSQKPRAAAQNEKAKANPDYFRHETILACYLSGQLSENDFATRCAEDLAFDGFVSGAMFLNRGCHLSKEKREFHLVDGEFMFAEKKKNGLFSLREFGLDEHDDFFEQCALQIRAYMSPHNMVAILRLEQVLASLVACRMSYMQKIGNW